MEDALTAERDELQAEVKATTQRLEDAQQDVRRLQNLNDASRLESNAQLQTAVGLTHIYYTEERTDVHIVVIRGST